MVDGTVHDGVGKGVEGIVVDEGVGERIGGVDADGVVAGPVLKLANQPTE